MNRALWSKAIGEARLVLTGCCALMFVFMWLFVWISSRIPLPAFENILMAIPEEWQRLLGGRDIREFITHPGRISLSYVDPVVLFISAAWAISRGSDCISGELHRGTMEMLLAQPVRRLDVLVTQGVVMTAGAVLLAACAWAGTWCGLVAVELQPAVDSLVFLPAAVNLGCLTFFVAGAATLASSWDRYRWRAIGVMAGFYMVQLVIKVVGRMAPDMDWLLGATFLGAFNPQLMVINPEGAWQASLWDNGVLLTLGAVCYGLAAIIFCRRDLPAPL